MLFTKLSTDPFHPGRIDLQEGIERAAGWFTAEDPAGVFADAGIEQVASRLQLLLKFPHHRLRSLEGTDAAELHD